MTPNEITGTAGAALSLAFNYFPGLSAAFAALPSNRKRLVMAGLLFLVAVGTAIWSCKGAMAGTGACLKTTDWWAVAQTFVLAVITNQSVDRISPKAPTPETV